MRGVHYLVPEHLQRFQYFALKTYVGKTQARHSVQITFAWPGSHATYGITQVFDTLVAPHSTHARRPSSFTGDTVR